MTSEVVIANASAMVFGADTMVTVTSADRLRRETEAIKIHVLQEDPPCALMIHGRTRFCGWPWSSIVSAYRKNHPEPKPSVKDTAESFFEWLDYTPLISPEARVREATLNVQKVAGEAVSEARMLVEEGEASDLQEALERIVPIFQGQIAAATGAQSHRGRVVPLNIDEVLEPYRAAPRRVQRQLRELTAYAYASGLSSDGTGLVFGGYGENEYLPSLVHLPGLQRVEDGIEIGDPRMDSVTLTNSSILETYAHDHDIQALTTGAHASVTRSLAELCRAVAGELTPSTGPDRNDGALEQVGPEQASLHVSRKLFEQLRGAWTSMENTRRAEFRAASAHMAPHELVELVTLLVTSASVGQRMSAGVESEVGGSVDILVMSREPTSIRRTISRGYQLESLAEQVIR